MLQRCLSCSGVVMRRQVGIVFGSSWCVLVSTLLGRLKTVTMYLLLGCFILILSPLNRIVALWFFVGILYVVNILIPACYTNMSLQFEHFWCLVYWTSLYLTCQLGNNQHVAIVFSNICKKSPFNRRTRKIWCGSMELIPTSWQSVITVTGRRSKPRTIAIGWLLWLRPRVAVWKQLNALHLIQENPRIRPVHANIADLKISGVVFWASRANNVVIVLQKVWYKRANELVYHQTYAVFHHSLYGTLGIRAWQTCPVLKLLNQTRHIKKHLTNHVPHRVISRTRVCGSKYCDTSQLALDA